MTYQQSCFGIKAHWLESDQPALITPDFGKLTYRALARSISELDRLLNSIAGNQSLTIVCRQPPGADGLALFLGVTINHSFAPISGSLPQQAVKEHFDQVRGDVYLTWQEEDFGWASKCLECTTILALPSVETNSIEFDSLIQTKSLHAAGLSAALVLATSGTTGVPKIVGLSKGNIDAAVQSVVGNFELNEHDKVYCPMPLNHVHGLISAGASTIASGGTLTVPISFEPERMGEIIDNAQASWVTMLPGMHVRSYQALHKTWSPSQELRFVRSSSAPLSRDWFRKLESFYDAPMFETYGLTESASLFTAPRCMGKGSLDLWVKRLTKGNFGLVPSWIGKAKLKYQGPP